MQMTTPKTDPESADALVAYVREQAKSPEGEWMPHALYAFSKEKPQVEPAWVSLEVACESIHVRRSDGTTGPISYDALRKRIARGHIPVRRMGGSIMVNLETLKNMKASR